MKQISLLFLSVLFSLEALFAQSPDYIPFVNPFIGASTSTDLAGVEHGMGKTFPGAVVPFGMVQLSPDTVTGGDNASGYSYEHTSIEGFSFTHLNGVGWYGDLGNLLVMPTVGEVLTQPGTLEHPEGGYRSGFDKRNEFAQAGYYCVVLDKYRIKTELTATTHAGMLRFTYPEHKKAHIQWDLGRRIGGRAVSQYVEKVDDKTLRGWIRCSPEGGGFGHGDGHTHYTMFFYAVLEGPAAAFSYWDAQEPLKPLTTSAQGTQLGVCITFATRAQQQVLMKCGISFVDMEGARLNLASEMLPFGFDQVKEAAQAAWNDALSCIAIETDNDNEKTVFYTALYHSLLDPRTLTDVDGRYPGGDGQIHKANGFIKRTVFSGWDVFRSQMPLLTIIRPDVVQDLLQSLLTLSQESQKGYFPRWELMNAYTGCMIGNPAVSVFLDAYTKGLVTSNAAALYQVALNTCERSSNERLGYSIYSDAPDSGNAGYAVGAFSISNTLELSYTEWCMAQLARLMNDAPNAKKYERLSQSYRHIYDEEHRWFRAKDENGQWLPWPDEGRIASWFGTVEANPYQQGWFVPHDIKGMTQLMGGRKKVVADLTRFFEATPSDYRWNDYYNHANEPVHHVPYLFNQLGHPNLTQLQTVTICKNAYHNDVLGLVGNDDAGQMSAWYVLSSIGLYQVCPGNLRVELTTPIFPSVTVRLGAPYGNKSLRITTDNDATSHPYIKSVQWNGRTYAKRFVDFNQLMEGGTLTFALRP